MSEFPEPTEMQITGIRQRQWLSTTSETSADLKVIQTALVVTPSNSFSIYHTLPEQPVHPCFGQIYFITCNSIVICFWLDIYIYPDTPRTLDFPLSGIIFPDLLLACANITPWRYPYSCIPEHWLCQWSGYTLIPPDFFFPR